MIAFNVQRKPTSTSRTGEPMKVQTLDARNASRLERLSRRSGFTLVELLTVIAIIGMLGAISISTVRGAIRSARETQTRTTIAKIDSVITSVYEKYQYRRVETVWRDNANVAIEFKSRAYQRVMRVRDLLRCDMPCCYAEVDTAPKFGNDVSPLQQVYRQEIQAAMNRMGTNNPDDLQNLNAELLYLVVTNADPESRSSFSEREIADVDGNGLMEFVDGWGKPICWMRWAPGLIYSDRQPRCFVGNDPVPNRERDPFDPVDIIEDMDGVGSSGWFLVPYVFSAGPDGLYGLTSADVFGDSMDDPFTYSRANPDATAGSPLDASYKDNIDNHTLIR